MRNVKFNELVGLFPSISESVQKQQKVQRIERHGLPSH